MGRLGPGSAKKVAHKLDGGGGLEPILADKDFPNTPDGLLKGLLWVRDVIKDYSENGPCLDCSHEGTLANDTTLATGEPPMKRLKLKNMSKRHSCMVNAITDFGDGSP